MLEFPVKNIEILEILTTYLGENADQFSWGSNAHASRLMYGPELGCSLEKTEKKYWILLDLLDYPGDQAKIRLSVQIGDSSLTLDEAYLAETDAVERIRFRANCVLFGLNKASSYWDKPK